MGFFHIISILIVLSAGFAYLNIKLLKLPNTIGLMLVSLTFSLLILITSNYFSTLHEFLTKLLHDIDFSELLLEGMLSFMLFAGAIHIKYSDLKSERLSIILFSTISVLISTAVVGMATFYLLPVFHIKVRLIEALLFGSLISPTDPIAVMSILKSAGVSRSLETKIAGESLFNDGVAVVIFITLLQLAKPGAEISVQKVALLFGQEAVGGILLGIALGTLGYRLLASLDHYQTEVLITLAIVMGGYTAAYYLHMSGPLAMVAAGLIIGNHGKAYGMSETTAVYIDKFWELIDEIMNAILFVLIGLELLLIERVEMIIIVGVIMILVVLGIRYFSVWIPSIIIRQREKLTWRTLLILTWGGLRGGISVALALSIPAEYRSDLWVTITYVIVCFSILVQGLTIGSLTKRLRSIVP